MDFSSNQMAFDENIELNQISSVNLGYITEGLRKINVTHQCVLLKMA